MFEIDIGATSGGIALGKGVKIVVLTT